MGRWVVTFLVLLAVGATGVQAAEQSIASLIPAQVVLYHELNLAHWHLGSKGEMSLEQVFEQSGLLPAQRALAGDVPVPGPADELKDALASMWEALQFVGPRIGWTVLPAVPTGPDVPGPPMPMLLVVADLKDAAAFSESVDRILRDNEIGHEEEKRGDGLRVLLTDQGPAVVIGPDWAALCDPPSLRDTVTRLASAGGEGSLAADRRYQRAIKGLPQDALVTQYVSPMAFALLSEFIVSASRPAPGVPLPAPPEDGVAWATRASVEPQAGRRMLSVTWTVDADAASSVTAAAVFALMVPVFDRGRESARKAHCLSNVKALTNAMQMYLAEHGKFPNADRWTTDLGEYLADRNVFRCADDRSGAECSYGMNRALSEKPLSAVEDAGRQVVIYESAHPGPCPGGGRTDVASPARHLGGNNFGFADGHAGWVPEHATQPPVVDW